MADIYTRLHSGGILLMSGLLVEDEVIMREAAKDTGFGIQVVGQRNGWISIRALKQ
jgi:ribosomal protein L11 methylase PrmA